MHLKWDHRRAQTGDENAFFRRKIYPPLRSRINLSAKPEPLLQSYLLASVLWSWRRDLNPRPSDYKSDALPAELRQLSGNR
jgi:hypothetical protein